MAHAIWKGQITFGLVNIPVGLYSAEKRDELSFRMLDRRDMAPIGYRKVNKNTGEEVPAEAVAKGYEYDDDAFVLVDDEDFKKANPVATQTIDIVDFVDVKEIPALLYDKPYWLGPQAKGEKAYKLLAETLRDTERVGIAKVVIRSRQYLACLMPQGEVLALEILRYADELRQPADVGIDEERLAEIAVGAKEKQLAKRLVEDMSSTFDAAAYEDTYRKDLLELIEKKVAAKGGPVQGKPAPKGPRRGKVIDLMEVLKQSVEQSEKARPAAKKKRKGA